MGGVAGIAGVVQSWFGQQKPKAQQQQIVLRASMKGTASQKKDRKAQGANADVLWADLRPVQELQVRREGEGRV
jgi:hypothetical protein